MKTLEYKTVDKSSWGAGPWQTEPDKKQWLDPETKLPCLIVRNPVGSLCGYVGVPRGHPCYGADYDDQRLSNISVHGGLTYANTCSKNHDEKRNICHKVEAGESDDVYWFGFDCAHAGDLMPVPRMRVLGLSIPEVYRDFAYITTEVESLAKQLASMKTPVAGWDRKIEIG